MNNALLLQAVSSVDKIGFLTPLSYPPDVLGVLLDFSSSPYDRIQKRADEMREFFDLERDDISFLLDLSEKYREEETPKDRRDRLLDFFAGRLDSDRK